VPLSEERDMMLKHRSYCTRAQYTGTARSTGRVFRPGRKQKQLSSWFVYIILNHISEMKQ